MKKYALLLTLPLIPVLAAFWVVPSMQQPSLTQTRDRKKVDITNYPVADFNAPETTDSKRKSRNQKRDKSDWEVSPNSVSDSTVAVDMIDLNSPAFPSKQATAIVIGSVLKAQAHLSNDKTGVYSAFVVSVIEILKNPGKLFVGDLIEAEREGGRVRFPSGRVHLYKVSEQDMPRVGARYVLFLAGTENESTFKIITGYELRDGLVYPLDDLPKHLSYDKTAASNFLNELRTALANP